MYLTMIQTRGLHQYLAAWREQKGLSQERLGEMLGHNKSTISRWEKGKTAVDLTELQRLADIYGVDPLALLLSPDDHSLAARVSSAKRILEAVPREVGERWLQTGLDIAGDKLRE